MKINNPFISCWLSVALLWCGPVPSWAQTDAQRAAQLRSLREHALSRLRQQPELETYGRNLLVTAAGMTLLAQSRRLLEHELTLSAAQTPRFAVKSQNGFSFSAAQTPRLRAFAGEAQTGNLFSAPPADASQWLDEAQKPLAPKTPQAVQGSLFPQNTKTGPQSYVAKRLLKKYKVMFDKLTAQEQAAVIETLDAAAIIGKTRGHGAAREFLEKAAGRSSRTSFFLVAAKKTFILAVVLASAFFLSGNGQDRKLERILANPALFLDASDEELDLLAAHPHSVDCARLIARGTDILASTPLTPAEREVLNASAHNQTRDDLFARLRNASAR